MIKFVKKLSTIILICLLSIVLFSCVGSGTFLIHVDKEVVSIELIKYDNPEVKNDPQKKHDFNSDKVEILEVFDSSGFDAFLQDLNFRYSVKMTSKKKICAHDGIGIRIVYEDDSFQIITLSNINDKDYLFLSVYDCNGTQGLNRDFDAEHIAKKFKAVINEYFTIQI